MLGKKLSVLLFIVIVFLFAVQPVMADSRTYTTSADFAEGTPINVHSETPDPANPNSAQLQLDTTENSFVFVNVAATARGTIVRIDAESEDGDINIIGEYRTAPNGRNASPSRTSVDSKGNVWTANIDEDQPAITGGDPSGSVVKIGIVVGGTRVDADRNPVDNGLYVLDPLYSTCDDRDNDGLIKTSSGLGTILAWPAGTDGPGGVENNEVDPTDATVADADDECILVFQRLPRAPNAHHVSVDAADDVWVGGYPEGPAMFYKLDGQTGAVLDSFDAAADFGCGGFGGLVDANGVIWSADFDYDSVINGSEDTSALLYYDPETTETPKGGCIPVGHSYGLAADSEGFIWNSRWLESKVAKIDPSVPAIQNDFSITPTRRSSEGVAVTPADNNVWVARAEGGHEVSRLDKDGNMVSEINLNLATGILGQNPSGVAVDANGKVWVTNRSSDNVMRIDPNGAGGLGAVDLTVPLGTGAAPDNYSDMAGAVNIVSAVPDGSWTVVYDSGIESSLVTITWNSEPEGSKPPGTEIIVEAKAADSQIGLGSIDYVPVPVSGQQLNLPGQFIQVRVTLKADSQGMSPVLSDLGILAEEEEVVKEACFVNGDAIVDREDLNLIMVARNTPALPDGDPRDADGDGMITVLDARKCVLECTYPLCVSGPVEEIF